MFHSMEAATFIQATYRGYHIRSMQLIESKRHARLNGAATLIQTVWRGYLVRHPVLHLTGEPAQRDSPVSAGGLVIAVGGTPSDTAAAAEESAVAVAAPDAPQAAVVKTSLRFDEMDLASIDRQTKELHGQLKKAEAKRVETQQALQKLLSEPADEDLATELAAMEAEVAKLREKGTALSSNSGPILSEADRVQMLKDFNKYRKAWVERKRKCMDRVGDIADAMEKKKKDLCEMMCIETDEEVGCGPIPEKEKIPAKAMGGGGSRGGGKPLAKRFKR